MGRYIKLLLLVGLACVHARGAWAEVPSVSSEARDSANYYAQLATDRLRDRNFNEAKALYRQSLQIDPFNIRTRAAFIRVLTAEADQTFRRGSRTVGLALFRALEKELLILAKVCQDQGSPSNAAEAFYQIGAIRENILLDKPRAAAYYRKALELNPDHPAARNALT